MEQTIPDICIGTISGTSMDAIDVAALRTDGQDYIERCGTPVSWPYPESLRTQLLQLAAAPEQARSASLGELESAVAAEFAKAITSFMQTNCLRADDIAMVGCHGQTVLHDPATKFTRQVCDCAALAAALKIDVVGDFRQADIAAGGEGAPLVPLYHVALVRKVAKPVVVLNLGGVGNLTYIDPPTVLAFDTGPANALLDDFMRQRRHQDFDTQGALAATGTAHQELVTQFGMDKFFRRPPPKSLDRNYFASWLAAVGDLEDAEGAATLAACTVASVVAATQYLPKVPTCWLVTGGGRYNTHVMTSLATSLQLPVEPIEKIGADGDALEAETFAFLACRSIQGLPLSLPSTTGVERPQSGGKLYRFKNLD